MDDDKFSIKMTSMTKFGSGDTRRTPSEHAKLSSGATRYRELLSYMDQVTRNDASEAINTLIDLPVGMCESKS